MEKQKIFLPGNLISPQGFIPVPAYFSDAKWRLGSNGVWSGLQFLGVILLFVLTLVSNGRIIGSPVWLNQVSINFLLTALPALGFLIVFANGGLDLSMGAVSAIAAAVAATSIQAGTPPSLAVILALVSSLFFGLVNGVLVGAARLPGLLVTLVMGILVRGLMNGIMNGMVIAVNDSLAGMPAFGLFMLILLAGGAFVWLQFPAFNTRSSTGASRVREALRTGLPYVVSALLAGIHGLVFAHRLSAATPMMSTTLEFENLVVMIMAGVCWYSRYGNVFGVLLGALALALLNFMLSILGVDIFAQGVTKGLICLVGLGWMYLYHWIVGLIHRGAGQTSGTADTPAAGAPL